MSYNLRHYAQPVKRSYTLDFETIAIEFCVGMLLSFMAVAAFQAQMILMFVPCVFVALTCLCLVLVSVVQYISGRFFQ